MEQLVRGLLGDDLKASMIGMPACTKTLSWREKCMRSLRGTFFLVISNCRTLFFFETSIGW